MLLHHCQPCAQYANTVLYCCVVESHKQVNGFPAALTNSTNIAYSLVFILQLLHQKEAKHKQFLTCLISDISVQRAQRIYQKHIEEAMSIIKVL